MFIAPFFGLIVLILYIAIPALLIYWIFSFLRRAERRADERLQIEKQNTIFLQKKFEELNKRLTTIENVLKEVE